MESSSEEVDLRLPVFLLTLPDASCVTFTRLAFCVWFEVKWKIYCVADVLSYTLPLKISWQSDWWQILVTVVVLRKIVFPQLLPFLYIRYNFMKVLQICSQSLTPFVSPWTGSLFGVRVSKSRGEGKGAWEPISGKQNIFLKRFSNLIDVLGNASRHFLTTLLFVFILYVRLFSFIISLK